MFNPNCHILDNISGKKGTSSQQDDADYAYRSIKSSNFVFMLHFMKELIGIIEILA